LEHCDHSDRDAWNISEIQKTIDLNDLINERIPIPHLSDIHIKGYRNKMRSKDSLAGLSVYSPADTYRWQFAG